MLHAARFLLIAATLFLAGLLDAGASIPKTRVGTFLETAPVLTAPESPQVLDTPLENWSLYDWNVSGSTLWTKFDPHGLEEDEPKGYFEHLSESFGAMVMNPGASLASGTDKTIDGTVDLVFSMMGLGSEIKQEVVGEVQPLKALGAYENGSDVDLSGDAASLAMGLPGAFTAGRSLMMASKSAFKLEGSSARTLSKLGGDFGPATKIEATVEDFMTQAQARLNSVKAEFGNVEAFNMVGRPANMASVGAGRTGALRSALRANDVPTSMTPSRVLPNLDRRGNVQPGRVYEYDVPAPGGGTRTVRIRDDSGGHNFGPGNTQNRGAHFNDEAGNHYDY